MSHPRSDLRVASSDISKASAGISSAVKPALGRKSNDYLAGSDSSGLGRALPGTEITKLMAWQEESLGKGQVASWRCPRWELLLVFAESFPGARDHESSGGSPVLSPACGLSCCQGVIATVGLWS